MKEEGEGARKHQGAGVFLPGFKYFVLPPSALLLALTAAAQPYPNKPIRLVTELAAGTGGDVFLRQLLPGISGALGQPVIVDNRPGAGGVLAAEYAARAA